MEPWSCIRDIFMQQKADSQYLKHCLMHVYGIMRE